MAKACKTAMHRLEVEDGFRVLRTSDATHTFRLYQHITLALQACPSSSAQLSICLLRFASINATFHSRSQTKSCTEQGCSRWAGYWPLQRSKYWSNSPANLSLQHVLLMLSEGEPDVSIRHAIGMLWLQCNNILSLIYHGFDGLSLASHQGRV